MPHNKDNENQQKDDFKFINETIKPSNNKKAVLNYILKCCISGLLFGIFACLALYVFRPWLMDVFAKEEEKIVISDVVDKEVEEEYRYDSQKFIDTFNDLHDIANSVADSMVSVKPYSYDETMEKISMESVSGVIMAESDKQYYILSQDSVCDNTDLWKAQLRYDITCDISLVGRDYNLGIAVFSLQKEMLPEKASGFIKVASLGNSDKLSAGDISLAVGNIFGKTGGTDYGIIKSSDTEDALPDRHCGIISVDMFPVAECGGFLFNVEGEVAGLFTSQYYDKKEARALGISDIKPVIELLVNGQDVPFMGIYGETISEDASSEKGIPAGVYVLQIHRNSPAQIAGISNADIIYQIDDTEIKTVEEYEQKVLELKPGDIAKVKAKRKGAGSYVDIDFYVTVDTAK